MRGLGLIALFSLMGCGEDARLQIAPQMWKDYQVQVETRPPVPAAGMNEILVIATQNNARRLPMWDAIVSVRASDQDEWRQAIQDGHTGVFRRAIPVRDPATQDVQVRIQRKEEATVLRFALH